MKTRGLVSLVGAGPGDPRLLTVAGQRAIERADVVLYDLLASPALLISVSVAGQERICVGKAAGARLADQDAICALLVKRGLTGQRVVRLKGGDPFVFGRGGEEARACVAAGVPFEIIPGVSAASAVPAYAGIPVTDRDHASGFTVVTGHERSGGRRLDWSSLAGDLADGRTLVVFMGQARAARWSVALIAAGAASTLPVALLSRGTTPQQAAVTTTLGALGPLSEAAPLPRPVLIVVGSVVELSESLAWFSGRPLTGQVIALTRDAPADPTTFEPLTDLGATVYPMPLTTKRATAEAARLEEALGQDVPEFTDLVFTSANGVKAFRLALDRAGRDGRYLSGVRTWAVGPATAAAMGEGLCLVADRTPLRSTGEGLVALAESEGVLGRRFLFPAARGARRTVPDGLVRLGATVDEIPCYETVPRQGGGGQLITALNAGLTMITVASPSAVRALAAAMDEAHVQRAGIPIAAIGPTTAAAARRHGLDVQIVPARYSMVGLVAALVAKALPSSTEG